jgi:hypothetical protein
MEGEGSPLQTKILDIGESEIEVENKKQNILAKQRALYPYK